MKNSSQLTGKGSLVGHGVHGAVKRTPRGVRESVLPSGTGWVSVDRHTLETRFPQVFAIGNIVSILLRLGKPLPKVGVFAHGEAEVVAKNIASRTLGRDSSERFDGHGACFVEAVHGQGQAGYGGGDLYAEPMPRVKHGAGISPRCCWCRTSLLNPPLHIKVSQLIISGVDSRSGKSVVCMCATQTAMLPLARRYRSALRKGR
ncbi:MAG: hypothetical protein EPN69_03355 [Rhodanobacter sp.]|nr:MAG: hypothetical protein EPN71_11685 [Rhodanobacter sp.]TAL97329.1 MAG: hypothetical protein EPN69_03355 [Rhodanobacter sp.]TAM40997.1 MAG: hypothetical protein EPN58_08935 [Rhodanobacter sp.]